MADRGLTSPTDYATKINESTSIPAQMSTIGGEVLTTPAMDVWPCRSPSTVNMQGNTSVPSSNVLVSPVK